MPDRIIRDELWQSERFLDLPTDAARLAFIRFVSAADDFGNFEGGEKRLFRMLQLCTQIKTEAATAQAIDAMMQCDLLRRYEVGGRELFHIPRFHTHKQYLARKMPPSPWCDPDASLGKTARGKHVVNQGLAADVVPTKSPRSNHVVTTSQPCSDLVAVGVGVEVGDGAEEKPCSAPQRAAKPAEPIHPTAARIPLVDGTEYAVPERMVREWQTAYPAVDVLGLIGRLRTWSLSNPTKRKTRTGVSKFINSAVAREQDRGPATTATRALVDRVVI